MPQMIEKSPSYWICQGSNTREVIAPGKTIPWRVGSYRKHIKEGDLVYFWKMGRGRDVGLHGWGKAVSGGPFPDDQGDWRYEIKCEDVYEEWISKARIQRNPDLKKGLRLFTSRRGSLSPVNSEQAIAINVIIRETGNEPPPDPVNQQDFSESDEPSFELTEHLDFLNLRINSAVKGVLRRAVEITGEVSTMSLFFAILDHGKFGTSDPSAAVLARAIDGPDLEEFRRTYAEGGMQDPHPLGVTPIARRVLRYAEELAEKYFGTSVIHVIHLVAAYLRLDLEGGKLPVRLKEIGTSLTRLRDQVVPEVVSGGGPDAEAWKAIFEVADDVSTPPAIAQGTIANVTADTVSASDKDHLGIAGEAEAFARIVASRELKPPLSIGVFGEWGSGKTFFMEKMRAHVERCSKRKGENGGETAYHKDIVQIRFNA